MEARVFDPYTARAISLGSGPRERASPCRCDYRTSSPKRASSCYTKLKADPPLIPYDKQRYRKSYKSDVAPLIRALNREPAQQSNEKAQRRMRPFSATTCTQADYYQPPKSQASNLISVRGRNMSYQERPHIQKRASESFLTDHIIQSIQNATTAQLSKLSLILSDVNTEMDPIPPCPSPEATDILYAEAKQSDVNNFTGGKNLSKACNASGTSMYAQVVSTHDSFQKDSNYWHMERSMIDPNGSVMQECEDIEDAIQSSSDDENLEEARVIFSRKGSRTCLDIKMPSGAVDQERSYPAVSDNRRIESGNATRKLSNDFLKSNPAVQLQKAAQDCDKNLQKTDNTMSFSNASKSHCKDCQSSASSVSTKSTAHLGRKKFRDKARPFSASPSLGSTLKCKTVEFLSEEDVYGAKLHISKSALKTLLYMDFLSEKSKLTKEKCSNDVIDSGDCGVFKNRDTNKGNVKDDIPPEMQITSKPPLPRQQLTLPDDSSVPSTSEKCDESRRSHQKGKRELETTTKKVLEKADRELSQRKSETKKKVSMIWRSITGIDTASTVSKNKAENELRLQKTPKDGECDDGAGRSCGGITLKDDEQVKEGLQPTECGPTCIKGTDYHAIANSKALTTDERDRQLLGTSCEGSEQTAGNEKRKSVRKIRFAEPDKGEKILRPTSAVIKRYIEGTRKNRTEANSDRKGLRMKTRPMSSNLATSDGKKRVSVRTRPISATVRRTSYQEPKPKVIASQVLQMKPGSRKMSLANRQLNDFTPDRKSSADMIRKEPLKPAPPQRPKSAPTRKSSKTKEADVLDIVQEEQKISDECCKIMETCERKGIKISLETLRRALMPPNEMARPYSRKNLPHSSRLLSKPAAWTEGWM